MRVFAAAALLGSPFLFVLHRLCVFQTVPYDDYAPYLLWLAGDGGGVPDSPYAYRIGSMALIWPVYRLVPALGLSNLPAGLSAMWLRATLAINVVNWLALVTAAVLIGRVAIRRCGLAASAAVVAGGLLFALGWFTQITAIDGIALLAITLGVALVERGWGFAALMAVSVGVNEKIALVLALWLGARMVLVAGDRAALWRPAVAAVLAVGAYFAVVAGLHLPGNAYQTDPTGFGGTLVRNLAAYASARGVMLNVLPIAVLAWLGVWAHRRGAPGPFRAVDLLVIPALAGVALLFTQDFQAGRIVMHAAPLFVIPVAAGISTKS